MFYRSAEPRWLPAFGKVRIYNEFFVAVDDGIVRSSYALKTQDFIFPDGQTRSIGYYHHPLSEGIVNKAHAVVGTLLLRDAMQRAPLLYCLGMDRVRPSLAADAGPSGMGALPGAFLLSGREALALPKKYADLALIGFAKASAGPRSLQRRGMGRIEAVPGLSRSACARSPAAEYCEIASFETEQSCGLAVSLGAGSADLLVHGRARCRGFAHSVSSEPKRISRAWS